MAVPLRSYLGGRVFGELSGGPGPLMVALHGWGRDHRDFRNSLNGYQHLLIDLPGFGVSPPPAGAWGAADYAACMAAVLDEHASPEPAVVLGHSFGGRVAVCLAASRPELVRAMLLCGVPLLRPPGAGKVSLSYRLARKARQMGLLGERRFEAIRRAHGSSDYNAASGVMRNVLVRVVNESYDAQLATVSCPVGLLWGSADQPVPPSMVDQARRRLTVPVTTEVVDGAGHDVHLQAPDRLAAMVEKLLQVSGSVPRC
jgi:pimeloyl-ACP methyl ester carboxylesterase